MRRYDKPPLTISDQVRRLQERGLVCDEVKRLEHYLTHIGYYRLSAYWLPFERPGEVGAYSRNHLFQAGTTFDQVLSLYIFDRKLRLLVMEAIERIEVAVRSRWSNAMALRYGSHAHMKSELFNSPWNHTQDLARMSADMEKSSETFVVHYLKKYDDPFLPPIWAVVETMTLGVLSRWFARTRDTKVKQEVAKGIGMPTVEILESVLHALTPVRNICAHHGRLWNRKFVLQLPNIKRLKGQIIVGRESPPDGSEQIQPTRQIYNYLVVMAYLMRHINPGSGWQKTLCAHVTAATKTQQSAMGFPEDWKSRQPWQEAKT